MTDKPPAKPLVWPSNSRDVTHEAVPMAIIGGVRPRPTKDEVAPAPSPASPERK
jgi:hypothetical protein